MSQMDQLFRALADRTRLRIINLLARGELCVCYFVALLGETQPKISRHLAYLRRTGIVRARREGKWIHYSLARPANDRDARLLDAVVRELYDDPDCRRDANVLLQTCCAPVLPAELRDAPRPNVTA